MTRPWIAFDLETSGVLPEYALQPWRLRQKKAWITTVAVSRRNKAGELVSDGTIYPNKQYLREILNRAIDKGARLVTWNGAFDIAWLVAAGLGDLVDQCLWFDAMLAWKHLDLTPSFATGHSYALKGEGGGVETFCPERAGYEADIDYHDRSPEALAKLLIYDKLDCEATLIIAEMIWEKLGQEGTPVEIPDRAGNMHWIKPRQGAVLIEAACLPMVARANVDGFRIDRKATVALNQKMTKVATAMEAALAPHGITETVIRSPKQLSAKIFDEWGLRKVDGRSTAKDILSELTVEDDRVALLMQFREALGLQGKFIGGIVKSCEYNEDQISRPQAKVFGTYTSRLTYEGSQGKKGTKAKRQVGFALHQMKRGKDFRSLILAPEGHDIVEFDAAGQEYRWMAILSGDDVMLSLCEEGEDPHSFMAGRIYNLEYRTLQAAAAADEAVAKKQRQGGKFSNFSLQYRTSPKTLRIRARTEHNLVLSEREAKHIHTTYARTYPKVPLYWENQIQRGRRLKYAETVAGRRIKVVGNWVGPHQWSMESTMINYPVQGTGGEQKYLALKVLKDRLAEYNARFGYDMHDGIYFFVPSDRSMEFAVHMRKVLDRLPYQQAWGFSSPIPLPWDAKIGPSWGALKTVED